MTTDEVGSAQFVKSFDTLLGAIARTRHAMSGTAAGPLGGRSGLQRDAN